MENRIEKRVLSEAHYMIDTEETIREIARHFKVSKSTVHKDLKDRLKIIDLQIYDEVKNIIKYHTEIRHIKGGESTKKKYQKLNKNV